MCTHYHKYLLNLSICFIMSGIEIAGLVLAVVPVIITALENYERGVFAS